MANYSCEICYKTFKQKSNYIQHKKRKDICYNISNKINSILTENATQNKEKNELNNVNVNSKLSKESNNINNIIKQSTTSNMKETKQLKGLNRNTIDKYYTKDIIVDMCVNIVKKNIEINQNDLIIEPSAGNGSFIKGIKSLTNNFRFYDLEPENDEIIKQDYLLYDYSIIKDTFSKIHVIGNPPFGRQSSLAIKFIKKSCEFCDSISFILPKSFKKDSLKKTFPLNFHLIFEIDLPDNSFLVDGIEYNVETVFQIWEKKDIKRTLIKKEEPLNFAFVKKKENPDISFRRVGVNAGLIDNKINEKSIQSHYFIKFNNDKSICDNIKLLKSIKFNHNNTVGPRSISKQELIKEFNKYI